MGSTPEHSPSHNDFELVVYTYASVTKQYNLVLIKGSYGLQLGRSGVALVTRLTGTLTYGLSGIAREEVAYSTFTLMHTWWKHVGWRLR